MKEALVAFGVAPRRIHLELFNGSEPITPGVVGTVGVLGARRRAPHLPEADAETGPLVSFARSGIFVVETHVTRPSGQVSFSSLPSTG